MDFLLLPKGTLSKYTGILRFQSVSQESKQEHVGPVLHTSEGMVRVYIKGDHPFENNQFRTFMDQNISVEGKWKHGVLVLLLENIHQVSSPPSSEIPPRPSKQ